MIRMTTCLIKPQASINMLTRCSLPLSTACLLFSCHPSHSFSPFLGYKWINLYPFLFPPDMHGSSMCHRMPGVATGHIFFRLVCPLFWCFEWHAVKDSLPDHWLPPTHYTQWGAAILSASHFPGAFKTVPGELKKRKWPSSWDSAN